jgi:hypothetical protein
VVYEVADVSVTALFHHRFDAVVCQHRLEQCKRFDAVKRSVKAIRQYQQEQMNKMRNRDTAKRTSQRTETEVHQPSLFDTL